MDISNSSYIEASFSESMEVSGVNYIDKFINEMALNMSKRKYRKVLDEVRNKEEILFNSKGYWKIQELKLNCICKIISHKLNKYENNKAKSYESWNKRQEKILDKWLDSLKNDKIVTDLEVQLEYINYYVLVQLYNHALFSLYDKKIGNCTSFLGLAERVIKTIIDSSLNANIINISQKIFLFISSLLISDNDFQTAISYQKQSLRLSLKEINFRLDSDEHLAFDTFTITQQYYLEKIFINIVAGLYQRGICEENLGSIIKAIETYRQARWFSKFVKNSYELISNLLVDVESRSVKYFHAIKNFQNELKSEEKKTAKELKKIEKKAVFNKEVHLNENNLEKYDETIKIINKLKIPKIEEALNKKCSENLTEILSTIKLVNNFLSEKFKGLVKNMTKLDVVNVEKNMISKIERLRNEEKIEEKYFERIANEKELIKSLGRPLSTKNKETDHRLINRPESCSKKETEKVSYDIPTKIMTTISHANEATTLNNNNDDISTPICTKEIYLKTDIKSFDNNKTKQSQILSYSTETHQRVRSAYSRKQFNNENVPLYKIDDFVFNKNYNKKIDYFKAISNREINFQKKLLGLKKNEKIYVPEFDIVKTKEDCEGFFRRTFSNKKKKIIGYGEDTTSKRLLTSKEQAAFDKEKQRLELTIVKSLDTKSYKLFSEFVKTHSGYSNIIDDSRKRKDSNICDVEKIKKLNKEIETRIENDILIIEDIEKSNLKRSMTKSLGKKVQKIKKPINNKKNGELRVNSFIHSDY